MAPPRLEPTVAPDAPELIHGHAALASALGRHDDWVKEHLRIVDPIPAAWTMLGLTVRRDRLALWCQRLLHRTVPREGLAAVHGRERIAKAMGISEPNLKIYMGSRAPFGAAPIYHHGSPRNGLAWAYVDALQDFMNAQTLSLAVRDYILGLRARDTLLGASRSVDAA